ncbi:MAG: hypothetical protein AAFX76_02095 [Planctomycetota bacterium]
MSTSDLTVEQINQLVGTRHPVTGIEFPPSGLQPYHDWLIRTLHRLADSSFGYWRVDRAGVSPTSISVAPGRASIASVAVDSEGTVIDLAGFNNETAFVWLEADGNEALVAAGAASEGWPATAHLALAEVALDGGAIAAIVDRRLDAVFRT